MLIKMLIPALLLVAACAHLTQTEPPRIRAAQNDAPAISPWTGAPPDASFQEEPSGSNQQR
jgi:hypothetical protein